MATREVLVSPGYGAGWSTWNSPSQAYAEYQPLIDFIKSGGNPGDPEAVLPIIAQLKKDFGLEPDAYVCTLGLPELEVATVSVPYIIEEYDGSEYTTTANELWS